MSDYKSLLPDFLINPYPELYFLSDNFLTLDFETTNLNKGSALTKNNSLVMASWYVGSERKGYYKFGSEYEQQELIAAIEKADFLVAHNAKFELQWLARMGVDISQLVVYCTQIAEYVLAGNRKQRFDLETTLQRRKLGGKESLVSTLIKAGVCPSEIPEAWLAEYCNIDVIETTKLMQAQIPELVDEDLLNVFYSRCLSSPCLADIEMNGMCVDAERVIPEYNKLAYEYAEITRKIDEFTGGINPRSPKQVAEFMYDVLKFPIPKIRGEEVRTTSKKHLAKLKPRTKKQKQWLALKAEQGRLNAAFTKTIRPLYLCVTETEEHILYANFNQTVTSTHRLSSSGREFKVQFQNFPRVYKRMFTTRHPGWLIGEADSSQLEFRTAVLMAQDKQGFKDLADGVDIHAFTASIIYEEEYKQVQEELGKEDLPDGSLKKSDLGKRIRQDSKENTFKPLYGGQSGTEREQAYYAAFREKYKDVTRMQERWISEVLANKVLRTITGLKFYWPDTKMHKSGYVSNREAICNYPVQMFATADIMPIAVRFLWQLMRAMKMKSFMVNTVHDSSISEVEPSERELWEELAELAFNKLVVDYIEVMYNINFNLPLEAEIEVGYHWSEKLKEEKKEAA